MKRINRLKLEDILGATEKDIIYKEIGKGSALIVLSDDDVLTESLYSAIRRAMEIPCFQGNVVYDAAKPMYKQYDRRLITVHCNRFEDVNRVHAIRLQGPRKTTSLFAERRQ